MTDAVSPGSQHSQPRPSDAPPTSNLEQSPQAHFMLRPNQCKVLLAAAAVSSACGLAVELLLGTLASYLVGNQALAYGMALGGFLAAMGIGSYLSQFIEAERPEEAEGRAGDAEGQSHNSYRLLERFIQVELAIAPLSALLPLGLFALFVANGPIWMGLILVTLILGILAGLEVPLLTRMIEREQGVKDALAGVLALDYAGALLGSLLFPVVLLPLFGLFPTAAIVGSFPALMVFAIARAFPCARRWQVWGLLLTGALWAFAPLTVPFGSALENKLYSAPVISRQQTPYQRIVLTRGSQDLRLYLDGELQLSSRDEYRYHEALVHPALAAVPQPRRVLLMGAGDGMALREILKWPSVEQVLLLELDPAVVELSSQHPFLTRLNQSAFRDPRVEVRYGDAFRLAPQLSDSFDVILADFPDPDQKAIAKLYSEGFYRRLRSRLTPNGVLVTQASSPFFAPRAYACVVSTLEAAGFEVAPYTAEIPSFGPWGFVMAAREAIAPQTYLSEQAELPVATRFLTPELLPRLFALPGDLQLGDVRVNRLSDPVIVQYQADRRWELY